MCALHCQAVCLPTCQSGRLHIWITVIMTVITLVRVCYFRYYYTISKIESQCVFLDMRIGKYLISVGDAFVSHKFHLKC